MSHSYRSLDYGKPFGGMTPDPGKTPVLCLPGLMCSPAVYFHAAVMVPPSLQLLPVAWMQKAGHCDISSVTDWLLAEMDRVGIETTFVAGHSASGLVALEAALRAPARVRGLLLLGTGANMHGHLDGEALLETLRDARCWNDGFFREFVASCFAGKPPEPLATHLYAYARSRSRIACVELLESLYAIDLEPELPRVQAPTIVVHGTRDGSRPVAHAELLATRIKGATLHMVDCGHTPMVEAPKVFELALAELLDMTEKTGSEAAAG